MIATALLLGIFLALAQAPASSQGRTLVVGTGDTVVVTTRTDARIVLRRKADIRISRVPDAREVLILVDEETRDAPPDGYVDRVYRYTLRQDLPEQYAYRGDAVIEEVQEITQGAMRRPRFLTFVMPSVRLRFGHSSDDAASEAVVIETTAGQARELLHGSYHGDRSFNEVEHVWMNHQEDSVSRVRTSLRMEVGTSTGGVVVVPEARPSPGGAIGPHAPTGTVVSWRHRSTTAAANGVVTPPQLLRSVPHSYSADAARRGVQGTVRLELTVIEDGTVSDVAVIDAVDPDLDSLAVESARKWRFRPALENGRPLAAAVTVEMVFTIQSR